MASWWVGTEWARTPGGRQGDRALDVILPQPPPPPPREPPSDTHRALRRVIRPPPPSLLLATPTLSDSRRSPVCPEPSRRAMSTGTEWGWLGRHRDSNPDLPRASHAVAVLASPPSLSPGQARRWPLWGPEKNKHQGPSGAGGTDTGAERGSDPAGPASVQGGPGACPRDLRTSPRCSGAASRGRRTSHRPAGSEGRSPTHRETCVADSGTPTPSG